MVNDQIDGNEGLHAFGIGAELCGGVAHGGEVYEKRHSGEVLQDYSRHYEWNFVVAGVLGIPSGEALYVLQVREFSVAVAKHAFEHNSDADRQAGDIEPGFFQGGQTIYKAFNFGGGRFKFC